MASGSSSSFEPSPCTTNKDMENENPTIDANDITSIGTNIDSYKTPNTIKDDGTTLKLRPKRKFISKVHYYLEVKDW